MRTYFFGFFLLFCAGLYFLTGCASHKTLAATITRTQPTKPALRPVRPPIRRPVVRVVPKAVPVVHDTIVKTVYLPTKITVKKPKRHCKVWE